MENKNSQWRKHILEKSSDLIIPHLYVRCRLFSRYSDWLQAGRPRCRSSSPGRAKNVLFSTSPRPALGSTQPWPILQFLNLYTARFIGRMITRRKAATYIQEQHKRRINAHRYQCLVWDSNPRPQRSTGQRRFMP
jgi:hypothetical protein